MQPRPTDDAPAQSEPNTRSIAVDRLSEHDRDLLVQRARTLRQHLARERDASEARLAESGNVDPMKQITGASALDGAMQELSELVDALEQTARNATEAAAAATDAPTAPPGPTIRDGLAALLGLESGRPRPAHLRS